MKHAIVNASLFRAVTYAQSDEQTRYYLQGVFLEPHPHKSGVLMTATDGHRLVNVYDAQGECSEPGIVALPPALLKECKAKARDGARYVAIADGVASILSANREVNASENHVDVAADARTTRLAVAPGDCMIDGTFPDWRRVVPRNINACSAKGVAFNPELLGRFAAISAAIVNAVDPTSRTPYRAMTVSAADEGSPALVRWANTPHAFGVIMPMRGDNSLALVLPDYMTSTPQAPQAVAA